jgi:hypothetical protein
MVLYIPTPGLLPPKTQLENNEKYFFQKIHMDFVMDQTSVRQGKETWLQPSGELQDKTRQDMTILEN